MGKPNAKKRIGIAAGIYFLGSIFWLLTGWPGTGLVFLILGVFAGWSYPRWGEWWARLDD